VSDTHVLPPLSSSEARRVDQTCDQFEAAWKAGRRPAPIKYVAASDEPVRSALLRQLLLLDWDYRRRAGDDPRASDYLAQFPDDTTLIEDVSREMADAPVSTRVGRNTPWAGDVSADMPEDVDAGPARYDLAAEIGHGGIGVVFRGHDRLLGRELAVKVLRDDYRDRPDARRRFVAEARVGSQLQHPAIVPVYEFGRFADGRPFITMKLVEGQTLAALLRERSDPAHDLPRFLSVFEQVCQAMAYAHNKGVIHRDLKPANVMVGAFGEVQVMDWGFAKIAGTIPQSSSKSESSSLIVPAELTHSGALMGTPAYMPPEQARGEGALIDPRADVFALGAVLCEILTAWPPYTGSSAEEVYRLAAAGELDNAHTRLDTCGADATLRDLAKRCLTADRDRRPSDAGAVARDVTAYLAQAQELLRQAQMDRAAAEARAKSERRARYLTLALAVALLLGTGIAGWQAVAATAAKQEALTAATGETAAKESAQTKEADAKAVLEFFRDRVLAAPRPKGQEGGLGKDVTIRAALDQAEPEIAKTFAGRPLVEASIRHSLAQSYSQLGEIKLALPQQERALALDQQVLGPAHSHTLGAMNNLAIMLQAQGQGEKARKLFEEVVELKRRVLGPEDPGTLRSMNNLANVLWSQDHLEDARKVFEEVLPLQRRLQGPENPDTLRSMNNLAMVLRSQGHLEDARKLFDEMLQYQRRGLDREHPHALTTMNNLALLLEEQGRPDEALKLYEETLELQRQVLGPEHADRLATMHNLAGLLRDRGRFGEARPLFDETLRLKRRVLGAEHPETLRTVSSLAWMLAAAADSEVRDPPRAVELASELVRCAPDVGNNWTILGVARYRTGEWNDAITAIEKSEALTSGKQVAPNAFFLAMAHWQRGEKDDARRWFHTATGRMDKSKSDDPDSLRFRAEATQILGLPYP
jgi:tetratricopeptide (TPR) repeat protein/tRNA A-37 threonylcarbamoyl transferase component Bud32